MVSLSSLPQRYSCSVRLMIGACAGKRQGPPGQKRPHAAAAVTGMTLTAGAVHQKACSTGWPAAGWRCLVWTR